MEKRAMRFEATRIMLKALRLANYTVSKITIKSPYRVRVIHEIFMDVKVDSGFMVYDRKEFIQKIAKAFNELGYEVDIARAMLKVGYTLVFVADISYLQEIEQKAGKSESIYLSIKKVKK